MLIEEQIIALKDLAFQAEKQVQEVPIDPGDPSAGKEKELPEYSAVYAPSVKEAKRISVHADGDFPDNLLRKRAPNQDQAEFEYSKGIYKSRTMSFWENMLGKVGRIWNRNNFSIGEWQTPGGASSEPPKEYFTEEYPSYGSIFSYFELVVTPFKMKDANAIMAYRPENIPRDAQGNPLQGERIDPVAIIFESRQVLFFQEEVFAFVELKEKSLIKHGQKMVREGRIFEIYDDENIWRCTQVGQKGKPQFEIDIWYHHGLGYLPAKKLRGRPRQIGKDILYQSYMFPAVPSLDAVAVNYSNMDMAVYHSVYPHKWEWVERCDNPGCVNGGITKEGGSIIKCDVCLGTGVRSIKRGPTGVYQITIPTKIDNQDTDAVTIPPFGWEAPDVATLQFLQETINQDVITAFSALNIDISNSEVKGSETALGKMIDREELFSWLSNVARELFDCLIFSIDTIGRMRYGEAFEAPEITPPVNFSIRTAEELSDEIIKARAANLPLPAFLKLLKEFLSKRFNQDKDLDAITQLVFEADRLIIFSPKEILMKRATIERWEEVLHDSIFFFIDEAMAEDENFFAKPLAAQKEVLVGKAKAKNELLPTPQNNAAENIIRRATGSPPPQS